MARHVWVVENDHSEDVPAGVVAVFSNKAAACKLATKWMRETSGRPSRTDHPGGNVGWMSADGEFGMSVSRHKVKGESS